MNIKSHFLAAVLSGMTLTASIGMLQKVNAGSFNFGERPATMQSADDEHAGRPPRGPDFEEIGELLALDDVQLENLQKMMKQHHEQMESLREQERENMGNARKILDDEFKSQLQTILDDQQIEVLKEFMEEHRPPESRGPRQR